MSILIEFASGSGFGKSVASARLLTTFIDETNLKVDYIQESIKKKAYCNDHSELHYCSRLDCETITAALSVNDVVIYDNCLFSNYVYGDLAGPLIPAITDVYANHKVIRYHFNKLLHPHGTTQGRFDKEQSAITRNDSFRLFMELHNLDYVILDKFNYESANRLVKQLN